jgi:hypothetical protein
VALLVALWCALATGAAAQVADGVIGSGEYPHQLSLGGGEVLVYWGFGTDNAHFGVQARTSGWVALGIGAEQSMGGADIVIGWADGGGGEVRDAFATGPFGPHPEDTELGGSRDLLSAAAREDQGLTTLEFSRRLAAADRYDKPIDPSAGVPIIWAIGGADDPAAPHESRGSAVLEGGPGAGTAAAAAPGEAGASLYGLLVPVHAAAMSASFLLLLAGMFFPRFFKHRKWWLKVHRRIGAAGGTLGLLGVGLAVYTVARTTGVHLRLPHSWIGLITLVLIVATPTYGQLMLKIRTKSKQYRSVHRWIGRLTLVSMAATIVLGLFAYGVL